MPRLLPLKDFRARRRVLTADDYAIWIGEEGPPRDLIQQSTWESLTTLPTDVAIQTSNHHGTQLKQLYFLDGLWVEAMDPKNGGTYHNNMTFAPMITASEEFDAATFTVLHGFYRPSIGCARNAL